MQAFATPQTISRNTVLERVSMIRYPDSEGVINESTLWRWCKLAGIPTGLSEFTLEHVAKLAQVAQWRRMGCKTNQIELFLGVNYHGANHRQERKTQQRQGFRPESGQYESVSARDIWG